MTQPQPEEPYLIDDTPRVSRELYSVNREESRARVASKNPPIWQDPDVRERDGETELPTATPSRFDAFLDRYAYWLAIAALVMGILIVAIPAMTPSTTRSIDQLTKITSSEADVRAQVARIEDQAVLERKVAASVQAALKSKQSASTPAIIAVKKRKAKSLEVRRNELRKELHSTRSR